MSIHALLHIALSSRQRIRCECLLPLQERKLPVNFRSKRSFCDIKDLNTQNVPSALTRPPHFSLLSTISLKSPVRNQGSSVARCRLDRVLHICCGLVLFGSPYTKVVWKKFPLYVIVVSIKLYDDELITTWMFFFRDKKSPPPLGL